MIPFEKMTVYTDYITNEIKQHLETVIRPWNPVDQFYGGILKTVGKVCYGESNYVTGPLTKTIYIEDNTGTHYKVSVEDLKQVKGHGWITHSEADELDVHYDKDLQVYVKTTSDSNGQVCFDF